MISAEHITKILKQKIAVTHIEVDDESAGHAGHFEAAKSGGGHYTLFIVSPEFEKLSSVARHRLIYSALENELKSEIHALSIKAFTPEEYSKQKTKN